MLKRLRPAPRQSRDAPRRRRSGRGCRSARVALWHELGCGVDAAGGDRRRLPIASFVPVQQAPRRCRWRDGAAISPLVASLLETDTSSHAARARVPPSAIAFVLGAASLLANAKATFRYFGAAGAGHSFAYEGDRRLGLDRGDSNRRFRDRLGPAMGAALRFRDCKSALSGSEQIGPSVAWLPYDLRPTGVTDPIEHR